MTFSSSSLPVVILGAGIGGLAAALALHRRNIPVRVCERAPVLGEVGAGLGLLSNAVRVLDGWGLGETIRRDCPPLRQGAFCNAQGRTLQSISFDQLLPPGTPPSFVVHRATLHRWLCEALPDGMIQTGQAGTTLEETADGVRLHFADGSTVTGSLLVGADGFRSVVRAHLWGERPVRYSGQTCYRGIAAFTPEEPGMIREVQGRGQRASVIDLGNGRSYWWAALNAPSGKRDDPAVRRDHLLERYRGWPFGIPEAIAATPADSILRNDLCDIAPLSQWGHGRITLLGDAAHPMTPNLGQGACSAIEDAAVLARHLAPVWSSGGDPAPALRAYEAERLPRARRLVEDSWQFGVACRWADPVRVAMRDALLAATPSGLLARRFRGYLAFDAT